MNPMQVAEDMSRREGPCRWAHSMQTGDWSWWDQSEDALEKEWEAYQRSAAYHFRMLEEALWRPFEVVGLGLLRLWRRYVPRR